ncbi:MAG: aminopeptidase [Saprospiraceae bacterium]|nr:MAG: aminopeptidase [Saprospiraceae bacterium]
MKKIHLFICLLLASTLAAQTSQEAKLPEFQLQKYEVESALRFLASDDLQGRRTGSEGNNIAARFLASQLEALGYQKAPGLDSYYQSIPFQKVNPPEAAALSIDGQALTFKEDFVVLGGAATNFEDAKAVFANYGWVDEATGQDDYKGLKVKGKVVFVLSGLPGEFNPQATFKAMKLKRKIATENGALALVEIYKLPFPWKFFTSYFGKSSLQVADANEEGVSTGIPYIWMKEPNETMLEPITKGKKAKIGINNNGFATEAISSQNVIGILEGSDPELKDEYVLLSAHYDHVGTGKDGGGAFTAEDSIFNGARDNAMGVVALMSAAQSFAQLRPKRSVIILAVTGEELGLLGSSYYASHPLVPLDKTIFNLNSDGAGYNDTSLIVVMGYGRTGIDNLLHQGIESFGKELVADPAPEQNLFDRSDNVSFAAKGVPALCFSPGFKTFDEVMMSRYHQVSDDADSLDFDYLLKFCQSFAFTARLIANNPQKPIWVEGDKYEAAGKALYGDK